MQVHDIFVDGKRLQDWVAEKRFDVLSSIVHVVVEAAVSAKCAEDGLLSQVNHFLKEFKVNEVKTKLEEDKKEKIVE